MTTAVLHVERAGPLVTIQDGGRPGLMRFGVPASGPMDRFAHAAANAVLGRPLGSTAIEVSLGGLALRCLAGDVTVSLCGGGFNVRHAAEHCETWSVSTLRPGDTFTVGAGRWGSWCYLAVSGDLKAHRWLNSASTHVRSERGGGAVTAGMELVIDNANVDDARDGSLDPPMSEPKHDVRVVPGPQLDCFRAGALDILLNNQFTLTSAYDRMGVRLSGPALELDESLAIPSSPIVRGSLQVSGDGVATMLLADHQTTGGYPKIATIISPDLDGAGQLRAGDAIRFHQIDPQQAVHAARLSSTERAQRLSLLADRPGLRTRRLLETNLIDGTFFDI